MITILPPPPPPPSEYTLEVVNIYQETGIVQKFINLA